MSLSNTQIAKSRGKHLLREEFLFHGVRPELVKEETIEDTQGDVSPIIQAREKLAKLQQLPQDVKEETVEAVPHSGNPHRKIFSTG